MKGIGEGKCSLNASKKTREARRNPKDPDHAVHKHQLFPPRFKLDNQLAN